MLRTQYVYKNSILAYVFYVYTRVQVLITTVYKNNATHTETFHQDFLGRTHRSITLYRNCASTNWC